MTTYRDLPCVFCDKTFSWQNDVNPFAQAPLCCSSCSSKEKVNYTCRFCGKQETNRYIADEEKILHKVCFGCMFWIQLLTKPHPNRIVTLHYEHYQAASWEIDTCGRSEWKGFGGASWKVTFLDDTVKFTNNLWSQGTIPELWRPRFTPNVKELRGIT